MAITKPRHLLSLEYDRYAEEYLRSLPLEHFMEATGQSIQREITLESLALVRARRPEVQVFSELLVIYPWENEPKPHLVVPDNMVVIHEQAIKAKSSFKVPLQPVGPFWVLEYVSKENMRKDYDENFQKYERELQVPYYLIFYPDEQELSLYRQMKGKYVSVTPNERGRLALAELDLEMALLEGWCRFWYQGQLLPLPGELLHELDEFRRRTQELEQQLQQANQRAEQANQRAEQLLHESQQARQQAEQERQSRLALEQELERLRAKLPPGESAQ